MIARRLLLCLLGLMMVVSLSGCGEEVFADDPNWLVSEQQDDFMFRMTLDHAEDGAPSLVIEPNGHFKVVASLGYQGDDPVKISYNERMAFVTAVEEQNTSTPQLLVPLDDPDTLVEEELKKGDWTAGQDPRSLEFTLPPGNYVIHGYAAFEANGKKYRLRTQFKVHVKKA